eukprot:COSAG01_NODE_2796_length_7058_cov_12.294295_16_plen_84_part_00
MMRGGRWSVERERCCQLSGATACLTEALTRSISSRALSSALATLALASSTSYFPLLPPLRRFLPPPLGEAVLHRGAECFSVQQ